MIKKTLFTAIAITTLWTQEPTDTRHFSSGSFKEQELPKQPETLPLSNTRYLPFGSVTLFLSGRDDLLPAVGTGVSIRHKHIAYDIGIHTIILVSHIYGSISRHTQLSSHTYCDIGLGAGIVTAHFWDHEIEPVGHLSIRIGYEWKKAFLDFGVMPYIPVTDSYNLYNPSRWLHSTEIRGGWQF